MDIAPLYELKTRLRAAAIAGTNLLSEDFRLKKAAENFKALESASPVFKKISELTASLLSDNCPDKPTVLLDTITLADSVICTLGVTDVNGELADIGNTEENSGSQPMIISNVPYSKLSGIVGALTMSGGGQYNAFIEIRDNEPELLNDYRVKPLLVQGLGASYSELADEVGKTILEMGKGMLPLLKKGFDPKGKKDMLRRAVLIERLGGADENAFYLEQLENAEKDIRKSLIYALRHDESNLDKLIVLSKTEKGKNKNAALSAMLFFDRPEVAEYFEEMAKKKPDEVLELMYGASSEWSSKLTARLIDELLIDDKGNKVTFSQAQNSKKIKLKGKATAGTMVNALTGKFGAEIEKIYREYDNQDQLNTLDFKLGDAILITNDESLKALALELNRESKHKGEYIYSEATVRMLRGEESSKWFDEQVGKIIRKEQPGSIAIVNNAIIRAVSNIRFENGEYSLSLKKFDEVLNKWVYVKSRPIKRSVIYTITDILIKYPAYQFDSIMANWADPADREYCQKLIDHFLDAIINKNEIPVAVTCRLHDMGQLGAKNIKGLALNYCKKHSDVDVHRLKYFFNSMPGDIEFKVAESKEIADLLRAKKLKLKLKDEEIGEFEEWIKTKCNYIAR